MSILSDTPASVILREEAAKAATKQKQKAEERTKSNDTPFTDKIEVVNGFWRYAKK